MSMFWKGRRADAAKASHEALKRYTEGGCIGRPATCPCRRCVEIREMFWCRPGEHHIRTRTVGRSSIRDEVIIHTSNPNSADNWFRQMFTDPPISSPENSHKKAHAMSPLQMLLLYSLFARPQASLPGASEIGTNHAVMELLEYEMIEHTDKTVSGYTLADRAKVYLKALGAVPLPVREKPQWKMPD